MNDKKDFKNIKQTQFDRGQVLKGSFSELQSALRTFQTTPVLLDSYSYFDVVTDSEGRPIEISYYQSTDYAKYQIIFTADVSDSLVGQYISITMPSSKVRYILYYVVSGSGSEPLPSALNLIQLPININTNDPAAIVKRSTDLVINTIEDLTITDKSTGFLKTDTEFALTQAGVCKEISVNGTGFTLNTVNLGSEVQVGHIELQYDDDGNIIWQGNVLPDLCYNPTTGSFESCGGSGGGSSDLTSSKEPTIVNYEIPLKNVENTITIPDNTKQFLLKSSDKSAVLQLSYVAGESATNFITLGKGATLSQSEVDLVGKSFYIQSDKDLTRLEILFWV